jgi:hypothetical protein
MEILKALYYWTYSYNTYIYRLKLHENGGSTIRKLRHRAATWNGINTDGKDVFVNDLFDKQIIRFEMLENGDLK